MNYKMIKTVLGWLLIFEALFMIVPMITAVCYLETEFWSFFCTAAFCALAGLLMIKIKKPDKKQLFAREGFVIVALSWIILSVFGAVPMWISGSIPSFVNALFESVSGFTTTGASILTEVESLPNCMLIWRSFTHWVGGMGVLVFIMAFLPLSGGQNMHIMKAESPGPIVGKLVPHIKTTALILYSIYFALTVIQFVLLICGGMNVFYALNTAFATAGTGGFGFFNDSFASFSPYIQIVVIVFMLLFSINFGSYYLIIKGRFKESFNSEVRLFIIIVAAAITIVSLNIYSIYGSVGDAIRHAAFAVSSLISTTGFGTEDFNLWPELSRTILVLIMFIGACAGSTGGGIKVSRIIILFKSLGRELQLMLHPKMVKKTYVDGKPLSDEIVRSVNMYFACYIAVFVVSLLAISLEGHDIVTNFTAVTATINNIGPGLELVGPTANYSFFTTPSKLVLIFDMLAGRLELFPMLLLFTPSTWKK